MSTNEQFLRTCTLVVSDSDGEGLDLSALRIKFSVKRSDDMSPNSADIRVYNLNSDTANDLYNKEYTKVVLQAGYLSNFGVIFQGNIIQVIVGRESSTDTYVDILAGDGDQAYNYSIVNTTLAAGSSQMDQLAAATSAMKKHDVSAGYTSVIIPKVLPRAKVMYGNARDHIRSLADSNGFGWSIQNGKINFLKQTTYLPGEIVVLTSKTGVIGTPQQTNEGVNLTCLINPTIKVSGLVRLDNASINQLKLNLQIPGSPSNAGALLNADGTYYVLVCEYEGDTRGIPWYCHLTTLSVAVSANPLNAVKSTSGGYA